MISQNALQKKSEKTGHGGRLRTGAAEARLTNLLDLGDHGPSDLHCVRGDRSMTRSSGCLKHFEFRKFRKNVAPRAWAEEILISNASQVWS